MIQLAQSLRAAFMLVLISTVLFGAAYPFMVTGIAQSLFRFHANGSLIERGDQIHGSHLLGQQFESPRYFWGRLSALATPYQPDNSGGSNLSPNNPKLVDIAQARIVALQKADPKNRDAIPGDLVSASGSGLDPHISLAAAKYQLPRVARARGMKEQDVKQLLVRNTHSPLLGLFDDDYVNIVDLNLALDDMSREGKKEKR